MKDEIMQYVSYDQILRYLHYNEAIKVEASMHQLIHEALNEALALVTFKSHFQHEAVEVKGSSVALSNRATVFESNDLATFIKDAQRLVMAGVTLGHAITKRIENRMLIKPSYGIILDACASVIADAYCDYIQDQMIETQAFGDYYISQRYSPGYGDLKLSVNKQIAEILGLDKKLGIFTTEHGQLIPEKSVIFVLGLSVTPFKMQLKTCGGSCETCLLKHCTYRRGQNGV